MQSAEDSTRIRILEIYASDEAYQQHLKTNHFQKYKQGTKHMVKSLKLPTMLPTDPSIMQNLFKKLNKGIKKATIKGNDIFFTLIIEDSVVLLFLYHVRNDGRSPR